MRNRTAPSAREKKINRKNAGNFRIEGYQSDMLFVANGETVTYTHTAIGGFTRPKPDPITPIPGKPFRPVRGTVDR